MNQRLFVRLDEDAVQGPESNVPAATLRAYAVRTPLQPYVSNILSYRETFAPGQAVVERVIPDGAVRLIMSLDGWSSSNQSAGQSLQVVGPSATPALVRMRGRIDGLAVTLQPGAAEALLGVPAGEIAGAVVPLGMLWREHGGALLDRMIDLATNKARVDMLQAELVRRLHRGTSGVNRTATHALRLLIDAAGALSVREVASTVGLGERRLQQLFDTHIGLSPSAWRRLARMHGCLRALRRQPQADWAEVALEAGFYDQSHLANEFQALCGCTPTEFRRQTISGSSKTAP
jgi:AraC-like DNA-binding protein